MKKNMLTKEELKREFDDLRSKYGDWTYDIPLPFEIWTKGNLKVPHTRLRRIVQMVSDLSKKPATCLTCPAIFGPFDS